MKDDSNLLGIVFAGGVVTLNVLCVICCFALLFFKVRSIRTVTPSIAGCMWWFVVVVGILAAFVMLVLYVKGSSAGADRFTGIGLLASIPYFAPMAVSGVVALFLKR
jgi:hypothetical protein